MSNFDDKLNKHIDKVIAIQNRKREKMLTLEELKEVDLSIGVTEEEWMQMMQKADNELKLAQNHFYYKNYNDAYTTAESAASINPHLTQAIILMADSCLKIYESEDDEDYLVKAELHAKDVLKRAPAENRAIEILALLNKYKTKEKAEKKKYLRFGLIAAGILFIVLSIVFLRPEKEIKPNESVKFELIDAEENVNAKWAQVENVISRRDKIIPQLFLLLDSENNDVEILKTDIENLLVKIEQAPKNKQIELQAQLQTKYQSLTSLVASKNNSENVQTVLIQIEGSYNRIAVEGKRYNETVKNYNVLVKKKAGNYPEFKVKPYFKGN